MKKQCPICGNIFTTSSKKQITCSYNCHLIKMSDGKYLNTPIPQGFYLIPLPKLKPNTYFINNDAEIWSKTTNRILKQRKDKDGYLTVSLRGNNAKPVILRVANIMLYTFVGNPPETMQDPTANHKDSNKTNNDIDNLEWMERSTNSSIRVHVGAGEENHEAILTEEQVRSIVSLIQNTNLSYAQIAQQFNVGKSTIGNIAYYKTWKHIVPKGLCKYRQIVKNSTTGRFESINKFI